MNTEARRAATDALDIAIARVVEEQKLGIHDDFEFSDAGDCWCSLYRDLRSFRMPKYNKHEAISYSVWYQPTQINLAYTILTQKIPEDKNPFLSGKSCLDVVDFGCGQWAMTFGMALSAADAFENGYAIPQIRIQSKDTSCSMKKIGWKMWIHFINEIASKGKYPMLEPLREATENLMRNRDKEFERDENVSVIRWLSALHVAYKENADEVKICLDSLVEDWHPNAVLITAHRANRSYAYFPPAHEYSEIVHDVNRHNTVLATTDGEFNRTNEFRSDRYMEVSQSCEMEYSNYRDLGDMYKFWQERPTLWVTPTLDVVASLYLRHDDLFPTRRRFDDVPF